MTSVNVDLSDAPPSLTKKSAPKEMLSVSVLPDGRRKVKINSSSLQLLQECPRKSLYLLKEKWRAENESPATAFGTAIHKALEVFYSEPSEERILPKLEDMEIMSYGHEIPHEKEQLLLRATRAFVAKAEPLKELPETDKRSIQNGVYTLWHYFRAYLSDPYVAYEDEEGPFTERKFSFTLYEDFDLVIEYFGTIDLIVRHITTGEILVADHKTSSVVGPEFYNRLKPNHQYTGYLMGAQKVFGLKTNSFMVNCIQVKERPKTSRGTPPHFPRQVTTRTVTDYKEFLETVLFYVKIYLDATQSGNFPLGPTNACATYGGCSFLSVCSAPIELRETILQSKFTKGETK